MASDEPNKIETLNYWTGETCRCGDRKQPKRWSCKECKKVMDPALGKELDEACNRHLSLGNKFADDCAKRRVAPETKGV